VIDWETTLLLALGLALILEGLLPMLMPQRWRQIFEQVLRLQDGQIRFFGLVCVLIGLLLFWLQAP